MTVEPLIYRELATPVGPMLAAARDEGLALLEFADRGGFDRIAAGVKKRHGAELSPGDHPLLATIEKQLEEYFAGERRVFDLPLILIGTPWQQAVWTKLLEIPYGETRSYGEVARKLHKPGSSRAVGRANGQNSIAIVVPCHRVIDAGGGLHGYGGGLWRKRRLLELEGAIEVQEQSELFK